uniref:sn-1-specific diacylglycerol lipase ABHD11 n=1 Tax=Panagrellus redivivus TaxID=6233 RepID=A0A7E4UPR4_PANRE
MLTSRVYAFGTRKSCIRALSSSSLNPPDTSDIIPVPLAFNHFGKPTDRHHPPLIIGHGLFGHKSNWNAIAKRLQHRLGNQVFAVDMRNHGESPHVPEMSFPDMAADLAYFIESVVTPATGFDKVHLLGHSMGGKAACLLALDPNHARHLKSVIVEDISPVSASRNIHFRHYIHNMKKVNLKQPRRKVGEDLAHIVTNPSVRAFLLTNLVPVGDHKEEFRWKMNLDAIENHVEDVMRFTINEGNFLGPSMFIYGEESGYLQREDFKAIRRLFPTVRFQEISKAGHWLHAEKPEPFMDAVVDFIKHVDHRP